MRWDLLTRGLVRYSLFWGGLTLVAALGVGAVVGIGPGTVSLVVLVVGVLNILLTVTGTTGTGAGAAAVEPASDVAVDPYEYAAKPLGGTNLRIFFWSLGLVAGAAVTLLVAG